jgi:hypothetical protein
VLLPRWVGQWVGQDLDLLLGWALPHSQEQGTELKNTAWGTTWENWTPASNSW